MRSPEKETEMNLLGNMSVAGLDVENKNSINEAITSSIKKFGQTDTQINNAAFGVYGIFELASEEQLSYLQIYKSRFITISIDRLVL